MKRIKDQIHIFEQVEQEAHKEGVLFMAFLKDDKCFMRHYYEPTSEEYLFSILHYYILHGVPDIVEIYSSSYVIDQDKAKKIYRNISLNKIYEKIIKKYGKISKSPFSKEVKNTRVFTKDSAYCFIDNKCLGKMTEHERYLSHLGSEYNDPFYIIQFSISKYETDPDYRKNFDTYKNEIHEKNQKSFISVEELLNCINNTGDNVWRELKMYIRFLKHCKI